MSEVGKRGYKETEIGWIPCNWSSSRLGNEVEAIVGGGTPSKDVPEYWGGEIPWASVKDFVATRLSRTEDYITSKAIKESSTNLIPAGTLITPTRMALGRVAFFDCDVAINQDLKAIFPKSSLIKEFLFYWFQSNAEKIEAAGTGSTVKGIRLELLREFGFALPPLSEQGEIVAILRAVDDKLDVIARQIDATQTLKQGLMQSLFSRGVGTQDAAGRWVPHTEFEDSELGAIPIGWEVRSLESVADVERGKFSARPRNDPKYFDGGDIPFVQTGDIASATRYLERASQFLNANGLRVSKQFPVGTIFITIAANIGDIAIGKIPMACPDSVVGIGANVDICNSTWLYYLLGNNKDYFDSRATQNAQKNINLQVLRPFVFPMPTMSEQCRIAGILTALDDKLDVLTSKQNHHQTLKRGLMQKLLTGEWRVTLGVHHEIAIAA
ncbi:restriction endonuclease subunit S [Janthinobacterium sp. LS2A]|uniref:restriction endonuclease subunit S n=1 Tax=Janthinobacterium sp. LS2A TaxID=3118590 RepID=UPI002F9312C9